MSIHKKILELMKAIQVTKDGRNDFHKYRFVSHAGLMAEIQPKLIELGLTATKNAEISGIVATEGGLAAVVKVTIRVTDAETGEFVESAGIGQGVDKGDKAAMKAFTAADKYGWMGLLNASAGEDPEADKTTDERAYGQPGPRPVSVGAPAAQRKG